MRLLFVCAGNIMRSVMAECILRARSDEMLAGASGALTSESCGIAVEREMPPHPEALLALEKLGVPACETNSSMADEEQMARADFALTMTRQQCYKLATLFVDEAAKCYSLVEVNGAIEMLLEARGLELDGADWAWEARALGGDELAQALQAAAAEIKAIPRDKVRQIPGVDMDVRRLMTDFAPCFYQASGIHDPLNGTPEDMEHCARLIDREVTALVKGLLALAVTAKP
jgi:protein-tyrosine-phosphatase